MKHVFVFSGRLTSSPSLQKWMRMLARRAVRMVWKSRCLNQSSHFAKKWSSQFPKRLLHSSELFDCWTCTRDATRIVYMFTMCACFTPAFFINFLKDLPKFSTFTLHLVFVIDFQYGTCKSCNFCKKKKKSTHIVFLYFYVKHIHLFNHLFHLCSFTYIHFMCMHIL